MKHYGNIDLQQNYLMQAAMETEVNFPSNPVIGRIAFINKVVWICADIQDSIPIWIPLTNTISLAVHVQDVASTTWTFNHGLNTTFVIPMVYDGNNQMVIPDEITIQSSNTVVATFGRSMAGRLVLVSGNLEGIQPPTYALEYTQTTPSTTWTIVHNLGYSPIVRVFIGNAEVQPNSIEHTNANTVTIGFVTPQMGIAKLI